MAPVATGRLDPCRVAFEAVPQRPLRARRAAVGTPAGADEKTKPKRAARSLPFGENEYFPWLVLKGINFTAGLVLSRALKQTEGFGLPGLSVKKRRIPRKGGAPKPGSSKNRPDLVDESWTRI